MLPAPLREQLRSSDISLPPEDRGYEPKFESEPSSGPVSATDAKPEADTNIRTKPEADASVKKNLNQSQETRAPLQAQSSQALFRGGRRPYEPERHNSRQIDQEAADLPLGWCDKRTKVCSAIMSSTKDTSGECDERGLRSPQGRML